MSVHSRILIAVVAIVAVTRPSVAQDQSASAPDSALLVDRIVAVVGDTAVLLSELRLEMFRIQAQGAQVPPEGTAEWLTVARQLLAAAADRLILLQHAKRSGITAGDTEVESYTDQLFRERRRQFASDEEMQQAVESSGMNMLQYRQQLRNEARAEILLNRYRGSLESGGVLPAVAVSEDEVLAVFERDFADQQRPATVSFNQIIVMPVPGEEAQDSAIARARTAYEEIEAGDDFEIVARRHSDDPGTRDQGGELGWLRRTALVRRFAAAAWSAPAGVVVGPVQTRFGLHLIKIETIRRDERFLRHILIRPEIVEADLEEARDFAASLADSLRAGSDVERLKRDPAVVDEETRFDDVLVEDVGERFGPAYARALQTARAGDVVGPFQTGGGLNPEYAVLQVLDSRSQGVFELEEVADILRSRIRTQKQLDRYIRDLRERTYVEVRL
jgi:peptidyl-prolyl cis-trans isomerase SurA